MGERSFVAKSAPQDDEIGFHTRKNGLYPGIETEIQFLDQILSQIAIQRDSFSNLKPGPSFLADHFCCKAATTQ